MDEKQIVLDALGFDDAGERAAFLAQACGGDSQLRARIESLLSHHDEDLLVDRPLFNQSTESAAESQRQREFEFLEPGPEGALGRLAHYEVLRVVGAGGGGIVFQARDVKLDRMVAIKVLAPHLAADETARERFLREARAAAAVSHTRLVTIYAVEENQRTPFLVMEFVGGGTLRSKIEKHGALSLDATLRIGRQVAEGLAAAHAQGLIHRDIKPANILLEAGSEAVRITDFGLARAADDLSLTQTGQIAGTPEFMSPEQAAGNPVDCRSDLFSLGTVLYKMCTGSPAFRGDTTIATLRLICDSTPRPIRELNPDVPEWLAELVERLLAKLPEQRYASAAEVVEQFQTWRTRADSATLRLPAGSTDAMPEGGAGATTIPADRPVENSAGDARHGASKNANWIAPSIVAAVLLVLAGGTLVGLEAGGISNLTGMFEPPPPPPPPPPRNEHNDGRPGRASQDDRDGAPSRRGT